MGKRYGIYSLRTGEMIEGGFFSRANAEDYCWREYGHGYAVREQSRS